MKKFSKFFVLFLCCALLVFTVVRPVQVNATTGSTFVEIATSYGDVATVAPYLIPFIAILIGLDWYYSNIDQIVEKATELYNNASSAIRTWADNCAQQIMNGAEKIKLSISQRLSINELLGVSSIALTIPFGVSSITLPKLSVIDLATPTDVFNGAAVQILTSINTGIDTLVESAQALPLTLSNIMGTIRAQRDELQEWLGNVNANTGQLLIGVEKWVGNVNSTISTWGKSLQDWLGNINSTTSTWGRSATDWLKNINSNFVTKFDAFISTFDLALNPPAVVPDSSIVTDSFAQEQEIISGVSDGFSVSDNYLFESNALLNANLINFLAAGLIFDTFATIPFFHQLLIISVSVGLIGALLGIALSAASRSGSDARHNNGTNHGGKVNAKNH